MRRFARELGVPIETTSGSGPVGCVLVEDLKAQVRERLAGGTESAGARASPDPPVPSVTSRFGPVQETPLTRVQKVAGPGPTGAG